MTSRSTSTRRHAFTLVELLVVIAIIGVLVGLLLPAVQQAREAARRMSCSNNLKNVGLAFHNYHDTHNELPAFLYNNGQNQPWRGYSSFTQILPFIEQQPLYDQVQTGSRSFWENWEQPGLNGILQDARATLVPTFICPSNQDFPSTTGGWSNGPGCSYGVSFGSTIRWVDFQSQNGMFRNKWNDGWRAELGFQDVTDGLSNTLMVSEHLPGDNNEGRLMNGNSSETRIGSGFPGADQWPSQAEIEQFGLACEGVTQHNSENGNQWIAPEPTQTALNTVAPPNWRFPNCQTSGSGFAADRDGIYTPRSRHSGGVQCAVGDGSVRFVADTVDLRTWQWFGSRNDAEAIELP